MGEAEEELGMKEGGKPHRVMERRGWKSDDRIPVTGVTSSADQSRDEEKYEAKT